MLFRKQSVPKSAEPYRTVKEMRSDLDPLAEKLQTDFDKSFNKAFANFDDTTASQSARRVHAEIIKLKTEAKADLNKARGFITFSKFSESCAISTRKLTKASSKAVSFFQEDDVVRKDFEQRVIDGAFLSISFTLSQFSFLLKITGRQNRMMKRRTVIGRLRIFLHKTIDRFHALKRSCEYRMLAIFKYLKSSCQ